MFVATSPEIDLTFCGIALRAVTNELARSARRPGADDTVRDILPGLFEIAARGRAQLADILEARYPDVGWGGDEMEPGLPLNAIGDRWWIYDPIDGAYHYIQGLPLWSASLALVENGEVVLGLVYDPATDEMFTARRGAGTTLNGQTVAVSDKRVLGSAIVGTGLPIYGRGDPSVHATAVAQLAAVSGKVFVVRQMASASLQLAYVAAGRLDAYWEKIGPTLVGYEAKNVVGYTPFEQLEGDHAEGVAVVEFPSFEVAKAWYDSPAYQEVRRHRQRGAKYIGILAEGGALRPSERMPQAR